jgi:hypothetical protein
MFDRISRSFDLARSSWNVLYSDKKLVLFPMVSSLATVIVLLSFAAPLIGLHLAGKIDLNPQNNGGQMPWWFWIVTFAFYFCTYFVIVFCNSALVSCAILHFNGEQPTLGDGFRAAVSRLPQILAWALVSATVGIILKAIENAHEKVGEFISALLGTAWSVLTFFVVPILVVEKLGPLAAISRSVSLLKKAWGEALIGGFGLGLFKLLLAIPGIVLLIGGIALLAAGVSPVVGVAVLGLGVVYLMLVAAVGAALDTIFLGALYQYAAYNQVPGGFSREAMEGAFTRKAA